MKSVNLEGKDFITTQDWTREELDTALAASKDIKLKFRTGYLPKLLENKTFFSVFYNTSTRTRSSFEAGMTYLGGHAQYIEASSTRLLQGEAIRDVAGVYSRYGQGIGIRVGTLLEFPYGMATNVIRDFAKYADVPVINMADDTFHPCQGLTDVLTVQEKFPKYEGKKFVIMWGYSDKIRTPCSIHCDSLIMTRYGLDVEVAHPPGFEIDENVVEMCKNNADDSGGSFTTSNDYKESLEGANIVFPRSWVSRECVLQGLNNFGKENELKLHEKHRDWTLTQKLVDSMDRHAKVMHVMPVYRGMEATDEVMDSQHSIIIDQAENRLHTQMAVLALTMGGRV
jgi:ornithine carbamoyltransferase